MVTRTPIAYKKGDKVIQVYSPEHGVKAVSRSYWQHYAGGDTSDYTIEFEGGGWDKSTNLKPAYDTEQEQSV